MYMYFRSHLLIPIRFWASWGLPSLLNGRHEIAVGRAISVLNKNTHPHCSFSRSSSRPGAPQRGRWMIVVMTMVMMMMTAMVLLGIYAMLSDNIRSRTYAEFEYIKRTKKRMVVFVCGIFIRRVRNDGLPARLHARERQTGGDGRRARALRLRCCACAVALCCSRGFGFLARRSQCLIVS